MKTYIGTKIVNMKPMTRAEYNIFRGWELPSNENGDDAGYLVEYTDGGKPNTEQYAGYVSWSPKDQADAAYRETAGLTFGLAIEAMKKGVRVARAGWNGKGMWLVYSPRAVASVNIKAGAGVPEYTAIETLPFIAMKTADSKFVPWLASQTDMLAEDWQIVT